MNEQADLTYYQKNQDLILNRAKDYYENDKTRLGEQTRDKYRNFSEEEKNKKREYGIKGLKDLKEPKRSQYIIIIK